MLAFLIVLGACNPGGSGDSAAGETASACADVALLTWDNWAHGFFTSYCLPCHSANTEQRYGAPDGINFDTEEEVRTLEGLVRSTALSEEPTMPIGGGVPQADLDFLADYLDCGLN